MKKWKNTHCRTAGGNGTSYIPNGLLDVHVHTWPLDTILHSQLEFYDASVTFVYGTDYIFPLQWSNNNGFSMEGDSVLNV